MPPAKPPLCNEELRAIWQENPSPVVRQLLWEIRRLHDEATRARRVISAAQSFATALNARGGLTGDIQLQMFWNAARSALEEYRAGL